VGTGTEVAHSSPDKDVETHDKALDKTQLQEALEEVGRTVDSEFLDDVFNQFDADGNGSVGLEEFKCAVRRRTKLEQWTASMPMGSLVASCFVPNLLRSYAKIAASSYNQEAGSDNTPQKPMPTLLNDQDPLLRIHDINARELSTVCFGLMDGFRGLICESMIQLRESYKATPKKLAESDGTSSDVGKFAFSMQGGLTSDFYSGLGVRVGTRQPPYPSAALWRCKCLVIDPFK
jgi:hypothetical protein